MTLDLSVERYEIARLLLMGLGIEPSYENMQRRLTDLAALKRKKRGKVCHRKKPLS